LNFELDNTVIFTFVILNICAKFHKKISDLYFVRNHNEHNERASERANEPTNQPINQSTKQLTRLITILPGGDAANHAAFRPINGINPLTHAQLG